MMKGIENNLKLADSDKRDVMPFKIFKNFEGQGSAWGGIKGSQVESLFFTTSIMTQRLSSAVIFR